MRCRQPDLKYNRYTPLVHPTSHIFQSAAWIFTAHQGNPNIREPEADVILSKGHLSSLSGRFLIKPLRVDSRCQYNFFDYDSQDALTN